MSRNGAITRARSRFRPASSPSRRPNIIARVKGLKITPLGSPDAYAPRAGFAGGWPVAYDPKAGTANLTHCYAIVGVGRDLSPDTGTGGELYAVIGHAPRHLDRNIALVGRVVSGIENLSLAAARHRGSGLLQGADHRTCRSPARIWRPICQPPSGRGSNISTGAVVRRLSARTKKPAGRFLHSSCRRGRPVQCRRAGADRCPAGLGSPGRSRRIAVAMLDDDRRHCDGACSPRPAATPSRRRRIRPTSGRSANGSARSPGSDSPHARDRPT